MATPETVIPHETTRSRLGESGFRSLPRWFGVLCGLATLLVIIGIAVRTIRSPKALFLPRLGSADWIIYPTPASGGGIWSAELTAVFTREFAFPPSNGEPIQLGVAALETFSIKLNGTDISTRMRPGKNWKEPSTCDVTSLVRSDTNNLSIEVSCDSALPALWVDLSSRRSKMSSDTNWLVSLAGGTLRKAQTARTPLQIRDGNILRYEAPLSALLGSKIFWAALLLSLMVATVLTSAREPADRQTGSAWWWAAAANNLQSRWIYALAVVALLVLWLHNLPSIPPDQGFDAQEHIKYIEWILGKHALPLASDGFQMYQPPLYYLFAAGVLSLFQADPSTAFGMTLLRSISFGSAMAVSAFCILASRYCLVFTRSGKGLLAVLFAAFVPFLLYLSYYPTNEIFAMALVAAAFSLLLRIATSHGLTASQHLALGVLTGLALLAKTSAIVLLPLLVVALPLNLWIRKSRGCRPWLVFVVIPVLLCLLVCGWHYVRVAKHFGSPFVTNTDLASGFNYWQQPGFITAAWYFPAGEVFAGKSFSAFASFWDGLYATLWGDGLWSGRTDSDLRPAWNYDLMTGAYLFAMVPALCILLGFGRTGMRFFSRPSTQGFAVLGSFVLAGLLLWTFSLKTPAYSLCKAFYASAGLASLVIFATEGASWLLGKNRLIAFTLTASLTLWASLTYMAFWIHPDSPHALLLKAETHSRAGRHAEAAVITKNIVQKYPRDYPAARWHCLELLSLGKTNEARALALETLAWASDISDAHLCLGRVAATEGKWQEGVTNAIRATELAPDSALAWHARARWESRLELYADSMRDYREAIRIKPADRELHAGLADALQHLGQTAEAAEQSALAAKLR